MFFYIARMLMMLSLRKKLFISSFLVVLTAIGVQWVCYRLGITIENAAPTYVLLEENRLITIVALTNLVLVIGLLFFINRRVFRPLTRMIAVMQMIAQGDTSETIPYTDRQNEIGDMARALSAFKETIWRTEQRAQKQKQKEAQAEADKKKALQALVIQFETNVKKAVDVVASVATEINTRAKSVTHVTDTNRDKLHALSIQIDGATRNVHTVSSTTTRLSSAIDAINQQVARANNITHTAVEEVRRADDTANGLVVAARKIGDVLEMIHSIAAKTNLLALNATIEAARAGDAGKEFAVVASEMKELANRTTRATEEMLQHITSIQNAGGETVGALQKVNNTIREINEISTTIASAVEQQGAATKEITTNAQRAAYNAAEISRNASEVSISSQQTGAATSEMNTATSELAKQAETLRHEVDKLVMGIRA